jgi:hypothetical protein
LYRGICYRAVIEIGENAQRESVALEAGFRALQALSVHRNVSLTHIDLGSLERLDRLDLRGNVALTQVALGALQTVDLLSVISNTSLSTAELRWPIQDAKARFSELLSASLESVVAIA